MSEEPPSRPPSRRRRLFRVCRKLAVLTLGGLVCAVVYVNQIGLPGFIKNPLVARLEARGVATEFSRLRWRWHEGLVAEDLVLRQVGAPGGPEFQSAEASVRLDLDQLLRADVRIASVGVRRGQFSWVLPGTNGLTALQLDDIAAEVAVAGDQSLNLQHFTSRFRDLDLAISGTFANPQALARPPDPRAPPRNLELLHQTMTQVANYLTNLQFGAAPELKLRFQADAADWSLLRADLEMQLPQTSTRWGAADGFRLLARVRPVSATNAEPSCAITLSARAIDTPWGRIEGWQAQTLTVPVVQLPLNSSNSLTASFDRLITRWGSVEQGRLQLNAQALDLARPHEVDVVLELSGQRVVTPQATARELSWQATGTINRTNGLPLRGAHTISARNLSATNVAAGHMSARITQLPSSGETPVGDETWGFWRALAPYVLSFEVTGEDVAARGVEVASVTVNAQWSAPTFQLSEARARLYGGAAKLSADVDVPSGEIVAAAEAAFDFHGLDPVFTERFRNWFAPYQWRGLPRTVVTGRVRWPDWRNFRPDWRAEVVPTLGISGQFNVKEASYRGIPGDEAFSDFHFTNSVWKLPNLTLVRPEGRVIASYDGDERTRDYVWQIRSDIHPHALKPLFAAGQLKVFDSFTNHAPPQIEGTIWGRWRAHDRLGFRAEVTAPHIEIRGERADLVTASLEYTNRLLTIRNVAIQQSNRVGRAEALGLDLPGQRMYFTNVDSGLPPQSVARAIGPMTARAVAPYVFSEAPQVQLNGVLGLQDHEATDLRFAVAGGPFHWWRFNLAAVQANLVWQSKRLDLTNVVAKFYGGEAAGAASFRFFPAERPTEFQFGLTLTNAQLQPLVQDVFFRTNRLEGALSGALEVTAGRADSLDTWQGFGDLVLRDGVIWDIPIFGIFSPVFNAISPGLGQSRADEARATFTIINGTIISRDLMVQAPQLGMGYQGSVDFTGNVEARMQARFLKDSGALGPLISTVFWPLTKIFEYRLSGTLSEPVAEPIHIPRFLFLALEPFKALQGVLKGVGEAVTPGAAPTDRPPP